MVTQVNGIDHVNIISGNLDATAHFYERLLGLRPAATRDASDTFSRGWLYDSHNRPILHLRAYNAERDGIPDRKSLPTGSIDHVALACSDFTATLQRCEEMELAIRVNDQKYGKLRQIFLHDPNNVLLELNFGEE